MTSEERTFNKALRQVNKSWRRKGRKEFLPDMPIKWGDSLDYPIERLREMYPTHRFLEKAEA